MTRDQFQKKIKILKGFGITQGKIAKKIGYSESQVRRVYGNKYQGDCSKVLNAFERVFK